jgi:hypothetical protein
LVIKDNHKNMNTWDVAIQAWAITKKEMFNAMKHKANILENQNVLMLFITFETNIINEDTQKYLQLHCSIELKKLWYRLVEGK